MSDIELRISYGNCTDIGLVRSENQDAFGKFPADTLDPAAPKGHVFIVADGMGGHRGGKEASALAVETIQNAYFADASDSTEESLRKAFLKANEAIYRYGRSNPLLAAMGTTCSTLVILEHKAFVAHVGDSRVYRITRLSVKQLTKDHSQVAEMVRRRELSREQAKKHPQRSILYRALGVGSDVEVDIVSNLTLRADEYYLLCSDGLYNNVDDEEMQKLVLSHPPPAACKAMVDLANERGGQDNITVQVVHVQGPSSVLDGVKRLLGR